MKFLSIIVALMIPVCAFAQQQQDEAKIQKEIRESLDKEVERLADMLDLEDWQIFYADSILTHNSLASRDEMIEMNKKKVSNQDAYDQVKDKWMEATYTAFRKVFSEDQWVKYNKTGALKEKKARDKRMAKQQ